MTSTKRDAVGLVDIPRALMRADLERRKPGNGRFKDLTGRKFAWCQVLGFAGCLGNYAAWLCRCTCGTLFIMRGCTLRSRKSGCGCRQQTYHGPSNKPLYKIYVRLLRQSKKQVCKRWRDSFDAFEADMGPRPPRHTIRLIDPNDKYEPGNCEWSVGASNSRTRYIEFNGKRQSLAAWARELGVSRECMRQRVDICLRSKTPLSEAVTTPRYKKMPSPHFGRRRNAAGKKPPMKIKDVWFNGEVHVLRAGKHFSASLSCESVRLIIQAEAETRGGKCKCRILRDCLMFVFDPL